MEFNKLMVGQHSVDIEGGISITVSSTFGQDEIKIFVPPSETQALLDAVAKDQIGNPEFRQFDAKQNDMIEFSSLVTLTIEDVIIIGGEETPIGSGTNEYLFFRSGVELTIVTTTNSTYVPPTPPPTIYIGGHVGNQPAVWSDSFGLKLLGLRNTFGQPERYGQVQVISADGLGWAGYVEKYDGAANPALTNPFTGVTTPYGYLSRAAYWNHDTGDANLIGPYTSGDVSAVTYISDDKRDLRGSMTYDRATTAKFATFKWNGGTAIFSDNWQVTAGPTPALPGTTSKNGRLKVQGDKYSIDGGPWITYSPGMVGLCSAHIPYTAPTPPPTTTKTTTIIGFPG